MLCRFGTESVLVIQRVVPTNVVEMIPLTNNVILICTLMRCVQGPYATHVYD